MTTETDTIKSLEAKLAAMTRPCPCEVVIEAGQIGLSSIEVCELCWFTADDSDKSIPSSPRYHSSDCTTSDCNGTGVVPLIKESRRECPCISAPFYKLQSICSFCASAERPFNTFGSGPMPHEDRKGCLCGGLKYVPDLDAMKVLAWMLRDDDNAMEIEARSGKIEIQWSTTEFSLPAKGTTPYEALLRACLAGVEAMEKEVDDGG